MWVASRRGSVGTYLSGVVICVDMSTEFYLKQWNAQLTVVRDSGGNVTGVIAHQNGTDHEWPKLATP